MIAPINYSLLTSKELFTFIIRVVALFTGKVLNGTGLDVFFKNLKDALNPFSNALERETKDPFTEKLAQKDSERDEGFLAFRNYVEACSHRNKAGWHDAATKILAIIKKHGWSAAHFGNKKETAAITNITSEIRTKCGAEVTLLDANDWLTELEVAQQAFETTMNESVVPPVANEPTIAETRPKVTEALKSLFSMISLQYTATGNAQLAEYAKSINDLIAQTMTSAKANATRVDNKKNTEKQVKEAEK